MRCVNNRGISPSCPQSLAEVKCMELGTVGCLEVHSLNEKSSAREGIVTDVTYRCNGAC